MTQHGNRRHTNLCYGKYLAWKPGGTVRHRARLVPETATESIYSHPLILQAGKMRPREYLGAQPHDTIMCGKLERTRVQESNQKQWKGRLLECQTEDPQKPFQRTHLTDRETEAPRGQ